MTFHIELLFILKVMKFHFYGSYDKQNLTIIVISYKIYESPRFINFIWNGYSCKILYIWTCRLIILNKHYSQYYFLWHYSARQLYAWSARKYAHTVGWLVVLGLTALRDTISVYIGPSPGEREGRKKSDMIDERKNVQTTPTRTYCKRSRPLPYSNPN